MKRVKIHVDQDSVKPIHPRKPCITVCDMDGTVIETGRRVKLTGAWILRQYRNPVSCGATIVLYPEDETAGWTMEVVD